MLQNPFRSIRAKMHPKAAENRLEVTGYCYEMDDIFLTSRARHQNGIIYTCFLSLKTFEEFKK